MSCLFSFKFLFAIIGWRIGRGWGLFFGFLLGAYIDSMFRRPTVRFTYRTTTNDYQRDPQAWQPYIDVTLQEAYRTLGIPQTATDEQVRQAYRQLALRYHPDHVASQNPAAREQAEKKFREITEARDIILRARNQH